ncbi:hypothetical protein KH400_12065 [Desertibacillus haloalkaliphilus]|nr:hypothetical protein [Desertibacillus haloalkaliphilus]
MNKQVIQSSLGFISVLITILYLVDLFFPTAWLEILYSSLAGIVLLFAIFSVRRLNQVVAVLLVVVAGVIFILNQVPPLTIISGFGENINLLTLFLLVPFFGVIISIGGYLTALKEKVHEQEQHNKAHPYRLSYLLTASMGAILNLGSMPIVYRIAVESFSGYRRKKLVMVLLRAFGFCMFWSPYFVNVGLVLVLFNVSWLHVGWVGFLIGLCYLMISLFFFNKIHFADDPMVETDDIGGAVNRGEATKKLVSLLCFSVTLLIISFILDYLLLVNMLTVVSVLALFYPVLWAAIIGTLVDYLQAVVEQMKTAFIRLKNEIVIFISAGFFGLALSYTEVGDVISHLIYDASYGSIYVMSILIILLSIFLSFCGIHPVIIVIGIGSSLSPALFGVSPEYMAVLLIVAWTLATQVSPFSGSVLMTSGLMQQSPWRVSQRNLGFVAVLLVSLPSLLVLLQHFGLL